MILDFVDTDSGLSCDGEYYPYSIEGLTSFYLRYADTKYSTWKARHQIIRGILDNKRPVEFSEDFDSIHVTYPVTMTYQKSLMGLLQFKHDFAYRSYIYDTFVVRRCFVGEPLVRDLECDVFIGTTEAFTIPPISRFKIGSSLTWESVMKSGTDWGALNLERTWIDEVKLINQVILDVQWDKVVLLANNLPEVPQFHDYRLGARYKDNPQSAVKRYAKMVMAVRGNCCVGKTSTLKSSDLPILKKSETNFREYMDGVIASDNFKVSLRRWFFDDMDHKSIKFEGLVHMHSMAITDLIMNRTSSANLPAILDGRYLCEEEIARVFGLWGPEFAHVIVDIDGDTSDLLERSKTRKEPRIQDSVIISGQLAARNNRCVLINTSYEVYFFKTLGFGDSITREFVAECHNGYFQVWNRFLTEEMIPGQSVAQNNPDAVALSTHEIG
jgi:hypothetical protein